MQIGIRLHDTTECPFEERLRIIKSQGFECVQIDLSKTRGIPYETGMLTPGYAKWLGRQFQKAELDIAVLGNYRNLSHPDPVKIIEIQYSYAASLRFAALCGACVVGTEAGIPDADERCSKEACRNKDALNIFIRNLQPVVKAAESCGVSLAIEPSYKKVVWNAKTAREMLDRISSPNLRIIFDPVNLIDPEVPEAAEETIAEAMDLLEPEIEVVHLKDYVIENGTLKPMGCGFGSMDYKEIIKFVEEKKPFIHTILENTDPMTAKQSRRKIIDMAYDAGGEDMRGVPGGLIKGIGEMPLI